MNITDNEKNNIIELFNQSNVKIKDLIKFNAAIENIVNVINTIITNYIDKLNKTNKKNNKENEPYPSIKNKLITKSSS